MALYESFRVEGYPTRYEDHRSAANLDLAEIIIITLLIIVVVSFFLILPGIRGIERLTVFIRVAFSIFVTTVIIINNFGMGWNSSEIVTRVQYKAGTSQQINATIGMWFGLRGVNVTLIGQPQDQGGEHIDYNEHFSWAWQQGKDGFGPEAGILQKNYYEAQQRGVPYPITWAVDYLTHDGDGLRYGRFFRIAGWYTQMLLWLSLPLWFLSNILMFMVIRYGAMFMSLSGTSMVLSCIVYSCVKNPGNGLRIPFENATLAPQLGWCFYLTLITGCICIIVAITILFMDLRYPDQIATFFGVDALQDYEEFYVDSSETEVLKIELEEANTSSEARKGNGGATETPSPLQHKLQLLPLLRKRSTSIRFQKSHRRTLVDPHTVISETPTEEAPTYENVGLKRINQSHEEEEAKLSSKEQLV